jgi:hypothetical protein
MWIQNHTIGINFGVPPETFEISSRPPAGQDRIEVGNLLSRDLCSRVLLNAEHLQLRT